jgi:hypothetical protein
MLYEATPSASEEKNAVSTVYNSSDCNLVGFVLYYVFFAVNKQNGKESTMFTSFPITKWDFV